MGSHKDANSLENHQAKNRKIQRTPDPDSKIVLFLRVGVDRLLLLYGLVAEYIAHFAVLIYITWLVKPCIFHSSNGQAIAPLGGQDCCHRSRQGSFCP